MASEKIINCLDDKLDEKQLVESANKICNGIPFNLGTYMSLLSYFCNSWVFCPNIDLTKSSLSE